jgi:hypothetical protein
MGNMQSRFNVKADRTHSNHVLWKVRTVEIIQVLKSVTLAYILATFPSLVINLTT